jgi:O-acetyl-ADP-ribose deacetylase (regulator of RNase III)
VASIEHREGNLLRADAEALVNTVNTVGVMGKGIALQFRKAFPANYKAYERACGQGLVQPGKMFVFETGELTGPRWIINFPTKRHWRAKTRMQDIDAGLRDLVSVIDRYRIGSVAIPPLGCGNGGLAWHDVRPRIEAALEPIADLRVLLFAPKGAPPPREQLTRTPEPRMTRGRAALLAVLGAYRADPAARITLLVAQKLAYLLQVMGEPLELAFEKGKYGPYCEAINHALQRMEGHFIVGYGDRTAEADIEAHPAALERAHSFLAEDPDALRRVERVSSLIQGFESPFGLELLSTVHWAAAESGLTTADDALAVVAAWNPRKREMFTPHHVRAAWGRLQEADLIGSSASSRDDRRPPRTG